jgi:hypothetical protein
MELESYEESRYIELYAFRVEGGVGWVGRTLEESRYLNLIERVEGMSERYNFLGSPSINTPPVSDDVRYRYTRKDRAIWMRAY